MRERERALYVEFVRVRYTSLYRTAYLLTGDHHTADDVLQTSLAKLFVAWGRRRGVDRPDAYARRVLVNEVVSLHRRRWTTETSLDTPGGPANAGYFLSPEQAVVDTLMVWEALGQLTARQRAVVVLRYYEDLTEAEIADSLHIAPGTVKGHARAALVALGTHFDVHRSLEEEGA